MDLVIKDNSGDGGHAHTRFMRSSFQRRCASPWSRCRPVRFTIPTWFLYSIDDKRTSRGNDPSPVRPVGVFQHRCEWNGHIGRRDARHGGQQTFAKAFRDTRGNLGLTPPVFRALFPPQRPDPVFRTDSPIVV